MRTARRLFALALAVLLAVLALPAPAASATAAAGPVARASRAANPYLSGRVLVRYRPQAGTATRMLAARRAGARVVRRMPKLNVDILRPRDPLAAVTSLRARPDVLWAEPEVIAQRFAQIISTPERTELRVDSAHAVNARTKGATDLTNATTTSTSAVKVGVIDDGVWTVSDLAGRVFDRGDCSGGGCLSTGAVNADAGSHGTAVATVIAAKDDTAGIRGVVPLAKIFAYRVFPDASSGASDAAIASAIMKAADDGVAVANMSLGTVFDSRVLRDAIAYARTKNPNMVLVAAAGNDGTERPNYPAGHPYVISVGAAQPCLSNTSWCVTSFSTRGDVDVIAPGVNVRAWYTGDDGPPPAPTGTTCSSSNESCVAGTSFAAPQVTGIIAGLAGAGVRGDRARAAVVAATKTPGATGEPSAYGQGRVDMRSAYDTATGTAAYAAAFVDRGAYVAQSVGRRRVEAIRVDPGPPADGPPVVAPAQGSVTAVGSPSSSTSGGVTVHRALYTYAAPASGTSTSLSVAGPGDSAESVPVRLLPPNAGPEGEPIGASLATTNVNLTYGSRTAYVRSVALARGERLTINYAYPITSEASLLFVWLPATVTGGGGATDAPVAAGTDFPSLLPGPDGFFDTADDQVGGSEQFVAPVSGRYTFGFVLFVGPYADEEGTYPGDNGWYTVGATKGAASSWQSLPGDQTAQPRPTGEIRRT